MWWPFSCYEHYSGCRRYGSRSSHREGWLLVYRFYPCVHDNWICCGNHLFGVFMLQSPTGQQEFKLLSAGKCPFSWAKCRARTWSKRKGRKKFKLRLEWLESSNQLRECRASLCPSKCSLTGLSLVLELDSLKSRPDYSGLVTPVWYALADKRTLRTACSWYCSFTTVLVALSASIPT